MKCLGILNTSFSIEEASRRKIPVLVNNILEYTINYSKLLQKYEKQVKENKEVRLEINSPKIRLEKQVNRRE